MRVLERSNEEIPIQGEVDMFCDSVSEKSSLAGTEQVGYELNESIAEHLFSDQLMSPGVKKSSFTLAELIQHRLTLLEKNGVLFRDQISVTWFYNILIFIHFL